mmetsp:Transcript_50131/g.160400  ORF Transcript_50131/g.160400 Transcript_50131/m.160400 type:complete len:235 (+) Transcript_50131:45-749(+)
MKGRGGEHAGASCATLERLGICVSVLCRPRRSARRAAQVPGCNARGRGGAGAAGAGPNRADSGCLGASPTPTGFGSARFQHCPPELASHILHFAAGCWSHRPVCRAWATEVASAALTSKRAVSFRAQAATIGLPDSAIFHYAAELGVLPAEGPAARSGQGVAELKLWREAGEPYGPQSDHIATWQAPWRADVPTLMLVCGEWRSVMQTEYWGPPPTVLLPKVLTLRQLMRQQRH